MNCRTNKQKTMEIPDIFTIVAVMAQKGAACQYLCKLALPQRVNRCSAPASL